VLEGTDVGTELLVNFLDDSGTPALYLVIDEFDLSVQLITELFLFSQQDDSLVELIDFR
jgi:hypothetical protein